MRRNTEAPFESGGGMPEERRSAYMEMQVELMKRSLGDSAGREEKLAWVERNSKDFAEVIAGNHELLEEFLSGNRLKALEKIEELLARRHEGGLKE